MYILRITKPKCIKLSEQTIHGNKYKVFKINHIQPKGLINTYCKVLLKYVSNNNGFITLTYYNNDEEVANITLPINKGEYMCTFKIFGIGLEDMECIANSNVPINIINYLVKGF